MTVLVAIAQIKPDKCSFAVGVVAMVYLFRVMVQLVTISGIKVSYAWDTR